jgi:hypothetical protein
MITKIEALHSLRPDAKWNLRVRVVRYKSDQTNRRRNRCRSDKTTS